jgi:hypothetical protein
MADKSGFGAESSLTENGLPDKITPKQSGVAVPIDVHGWISQ